MLEIILHAGTLLAVLVVYRRDLGLICLDAASSCGALPREGWRALVRARELGLLLLASLPAAAAAILARGSIESAFESPGVASGFLMLTGLILLASRWARPRVDRVGWRTSLLMGVAQAISLMPGVSRSGATISAGLFGHLTARKAVRFSFLMSVPAILGSLVVSLPDLAVSLRMEVLPAYGVGFLVAFLSGFAAIHLLLRVVARGRFFLFGIYCLSIGLFGLIWFR